jgi:hypothetical protein
LVFQPKNRRPALLRSRRERGGGTIKAILWTVVLVYGAYVAYKIIPAYVAEYQLADKMAEQARFAVVNQYPEDQIRDTVYKTMQELDIPAKREDIKIVASKSVVKISLDYTVPVDLLVYHIDLHFTPESENKSIV